MQLLIVNINMSKSIILIELVVGIIFISGCIQQEKSTLDIKSTPLVQQDTDMQILSRNEIQFIDINEKLTCVDLIYLRDKEFIINTDAEYQTLFDYKSSSPICEDFKLPSIDFSQYTLLGKYTQGCSINFSRKVYKDDTNKKIVYSVRVIEEGACEKLGMSMNWALVQKIPSDYIVEFEVK